jgi:hypothetical protein
MLLTTAHPLPTLASPLLTLAHPALPIKQPCSPFRTETDFVQVRTQVKQPAVIVIIKPKNRYNIDESGIIKGYKANRLIIKGSERRSI